MIGRHGSRSEHHESSERRRRAARQVSLGRGARAVGLLNAAASKISFGLAGSTAVDGTHQRASPGGSSIQK